MTKLHLRSAALAALVVMASCSSNLQDEPARSDTSRDVTARQTNLPTELPPMRAFTMGGVQPVQRSNAAIAADFLDLSFELESGRQLPVLTRFEGPVTIRVTGRAPAVLSGDLNRLVGRLRSEAGIDISRVGPNENASITLEIISKAQLQKLVPNAACFVAPNVSSWMEYKAKRGTPETDWTAIRERSRMAIFIPGDVAPQEMRDCLHEETAQALGPVNDLWRLSDSVFNDDNFHTVLTGFDMLVLRAYYTSELRSGMTKAEVATRLPSLLARLNPNGGGGAPAPVSKTPAAWKQAIETALGGRTPAGARRSAAKRAVEIARAMGWRDTRLAFALFVQGRLNLGVNSDVALASFREAEAIYGTTPGNQLQAAHMGVQLAAHALSMGNAGTAIRIADAHMPSVQRAENAALLATLLMIKAEAMTLEGRVAEAQLVRLDSLGWARYGFGSESDVTERLKEIAAISPRSRG
ncbi:DUF2927 domain-containing protein [uncultured Maritimibacter sp.]|jgi:hypothetical protein|uniref:DUF2927 domain-containing protein n=1 Tax=uncultured Maritimibacter sp. TaxID=991866 RepID=UPI000A9ACEB8|nr:DUF2927 domain-containing protein [uncultured Maritimibacter sp.]